MTELILKYSSLSTEIGEIFIASTYKGICDITIGKNENDFVENIKNKYRFEILRDDKHLKNEIKELKEYFNNKLKKFESKLDIREGTKFQRKVWKYLEKIPYGETCSYKQIAKQVGNNKGYRAVGNANGKNPIPIIIPCHRVITTNGKLGGYGSGIWRKEILLRLEGVNL